MKSVEFVKRTVCAVLVLSAFPGAAAVPLFAEDLNAIILRVNDEISTYYDYRERKSARVRAIQESELALEERQQLEADAGKATMREILDEMLLLSRARQLVIEPSKGELDEAMDATRNRMGLTTEDAFAKALRSAGMSLEDFRERTSRSIRVNAVIQREVRAKVEVDDEWLQRTYRERQEEFRVPAKAKVQEIVIPADKLSGQKAREVAEVMRVAIAGGESMADVVARLGGGDATGPVDLGWVEEGELAPALEAAVAGLVAGAVSSPVEARGGLHLLQVLERSESTIRPLAEVKEELAAEEQSRLFQEKMRTYLADLEARAYLLENTPPEAVGYREVTRDDANDPLAAFAPKRAPAPAPVTPPPGAPGSPASAPPEPGSPPE
ncbi:MAG: peptidyl-prolyl cis-trans isomerase [Thermoanaerobaculia bacterium]|nr:peptidyl-prolyl cis-trans isomerase [Thermoanaerobaculia bacterium]